MSYVEIERKFLVDPKKLPYPLQPLKATPITQGYLSDDPWVRIRLVGDHDALLTIKGKGNVTRQEFEFPIPRDAAQQMLDTLCKSTLSKVRYELEYRDHIWSVDQFAGNLAPLWLAEIELHSEDEPFEIPPWATEEVSDKVQFTNAYLAKNYGNHPWKPSNS